MFIIMDNVTLLMTEDTQEDKPRRELIGSREAVESRFDYEYSVKSRPKKDQSA